MDEKMKGYADKLRKRDLRMDRIQKGYDFCFIV